MVLSPGCLKLTPADESWKSRAEKLFLLFEVLFLLDTRDLSVEETFVVAAVVVLSAFCEVNSGKTYQE